MPPPRLCVVALAFAGGVAAVAASGPLAAAPAAWTLIACGLVLTPVGAHARGRAVVAAALCTGAAAGSLEARRLAAPPALPAGVTATGEWAELEGVVVGAIEDRPGAVDSAAGGASEEDAGAGGAGRPVVRAFVVQIQTGARVAVRSHGTPAPEVLPGDRVRVNGPLREPRGYRVPGARDARRLAAARGVHFEMSVPATEVEILGSGASAWRAAARTQRAAATAIEARGGSPAGRAVVRALVAGDRGAIDPALAERFRRAGVAHVLAVSGLHLTVVTFLAFVAVRRLWPLVPGAEALADPIRAAAIAAAPVAIAYTLVTGARPSTVRALVVVLAVLFGLASDRRARTLDALGLAAIAILLRRPSALSDPSFQLSFAAAGTLSLVFAGRAAASGVGERALSLARATLWATGATAPLTALAFGKVALGGLAANLVVVPLVELVVLPVGLAGAALSAPWPAAGGLLLDLSIAVAGFAADAAGLVAARAPTLLVPPPGAVELVGFAALWAGAVLAARRLRPRVALLLAGAGAAAVAGSWIYTAEIAPRHRTELRVTFLDVGQGDAAVIELPGGGVWLVDAGGQPFVAGRVGEERRRAASAPGEAVVAYLAHRRIRRIDRVIVSHPHADHVEGLWAALRAVRIGEVWVARPHVDQPRPGFYLDLLFRMVLRGARVRTPPLGLADEVAGVRLEVLAPRYRGEAMTDPTMGLNDNSLVVVVERAGRRILFAGDLEREGEAIVLEEAPGSLRSDVVKVGHHGSRTSSVPAFVAATGASWAVISCGFANRFGFPAPEVVARWEEAGARVVRTDLGGAVTVTVSAAGALSVTTFDPVAPAARAPAPVRR